MGDSRPVVTLLTDFGLQDPYVGIMKGVILGICPLATLVDLTHRVPPQAVEIGAYQLEAAWRFFPVGTVHLAVVDPGVGGARLPLAVAAGGQLFVGPDNGLLESALASSGAIACAATDPRFHRPDVSHTFHGRDVFAPVAAWLARGIALAELGPPVSEPVRLTLPQRLWRAGALEGCVAVVDGFGNLITDVPAREARRAFEAGAALEIGDARLSTLSATYAQVEEGALLALIGSTGRLEVSVRGGSAADRLGLGVGAAVRLVGASGLDAQG